MQSHPRRAGEESEAVGQEDGSPVLGLRNLPLRRQDVRPVKRAQICVRQMSKQD